MMITILFQLTLLLWFLGCTVSYRTRRFVLVEGVGVKSAEFFMLIVYAIALVFFHAFSWGRWALLGVLAAWLIVQFFCHWRYTIFGASEKKLRGYNECFRGTLRIFKESETRLVPDLYHIVLHALIIVNIVFCIIK